MTVLWNISIRSTILLLFSPTKCVKWAADELLKPSPLLIVTWGDVTISEFIKVGKSLIHILLIFLLISGCQFDDLYKTFQPSPECSIGKVIRMIQTIFSQHWIRIKAQSKQYAKRNIGTAMCNHFFNWKQKTAAQIGSLFEFFYILSKKILTKLCPCILPS